MGGDGENVTPIGIPLKSLQPAALSFPGYGHMAPLSAGGKAFCVVYAALGLPASLALVAALRHCLLPVFNSPATWVAVRWQLAPAQAALLQAAGLGLLVACVFVLLPALVLWAMQGDCSLLEVCFGSLSTMGLGHCCPAVGVACAQPFTTLDSSQFLVSPERRRVEEPGLQPREGSYPRVRNERWSPKSTGAMLGAASGARVAHHTGNWVGSIVSTLRATLTSSSPQVLLLGLLAVLLAVETFSELPQVRAMVKFFGPSGSRTDEDQDGILGQDELALSTMPPDPPALEQTIPAPTPEQTPAC